jgi:hypothetical protein
MSFKSDNWLIGAERRLLIAITVTDPDTYLGVSRRETGYPSNPTLYFTDIPDPSTGNFTYGGTTYSPMVQKFSGNAASIDFRGSASDADATLVLANIRYPFQFKHSVGANESNQYNVKLSQLFADYLWSGATFTATCYCKVGATETTQDVFKGIVYDVSATVNTVVIRLIQDKKNIRLKPDSEGPGSSTYPSIVTTTAYPKAPPSSIGAVLPMTYSYSGIIPIIEGQYGLCVNPANILSLWQPVLYEAQYDGTYLGRFMAGAYPTQTAPATASMYWFYSVSNPSTLAVMKTSDVTFTANTTETYGSIFANASAYIYLNPTDFRNKSGANVTDPGKTFDGRDDTYGAITSAGATEYLACNLPKMSPLGKVTGSYMWVLLAPGTGVGAGDGTVNGQFGIYEDNTPGYHHSVTGNLTKANLRDGGFISLDLTTATYSDGEWADWRWEDTTGAGIVFDLYPRVEVSTSGATANVIAWGIRVQHIPAGIFYSNGYRPNSNGWTALGQTRGRTMKGRS